MKNRLSQYTIGIIGFNILALLFISLYLFKGWHSRPFRFMDLIFFKELFITFSTIPLYALWMQKLYADKTDDRKFMRGFLAFLFLLLISLYGAGMHNAANQIRAVVNEPIVYFYDEIFSHFIFMSALFGMGISLAWLQFNAPRAIIMGRVEKVTIIASSVFQGIIIGVGTMEAHYAPYALGLGAIFTVALVFWLRKTTISQYPLTWYYGLHFASITVFLALFLLINHHFVEPSTLFKGG